MKDIARSLLTLARTLAEDKQAATPEEFAQRFKEGPKVKSHERLQKEMSERVKSDPGFLQYMQEQAAGSHEAVADYITNLLGELKHSKGDPGQTFQQLLTKLKHDQQVFSKAVEHTNRERRKAAVELVRLAKALLNED